MQKRDHIHTVGSTITKFLPALIILLLLPFMLAFDSVMYWVTRPTCLNCGSLAGYLREGSLSVAMVSNMIGEFGIGSFKFGKGKNG